MNDAINISGEARRVLTRLACPRLLGPLVAALLLLAGASQATAATVIAGPGQGAGQVSAPRGLAVDFETGRLYVADRDNHRVDVFDSSGQFAMAFGWGVADGKAEPQTCGPAASPPTASCRQGLEGGGGGQFRNPIDVAVDNSPSGASRHDVYVIDGPSGEEEAAGGGVRVEKFSPDGKFLLTWGGGVISAGAEGTGNLSAGSTQVNGVQTLERSFERGQTIAAPGKLASETKIVDIGAGTITLSKPALASGSAVTLEVEPGPSNMAVNETQEINGALSGSNSRLIFRTPNPSPSEASVTITMTPSASELQAKLEGLPNIGPGNVAVAGSTGGPYTVEFKGSRFGDTNVAQLQQLGAGSGTPFTTRNGHGAAEICTAAIAASCSAGVEGSGSGQFDDPGSAHIAVGPDGAVYISDQVYEPIGDKRAHARERLQKFQPDGSFVEELTLPGNPPEISDLAVDSSGDFYIAVQAGERGLRKYDSAGVLLETLTTEPTFGLSVDDADHVFAEEEVPIVGDKAIAEFAPGGAVLRRFGYREVPPANSGGLATHPGGIYASGEKGSVGNESVLEDLSFPPPGPVLLPEPCTPSFLGNDKATLRAFVNPEGKATTFHFEYLTQTDYEANLAEGPDGFAGAHPASSSPETSAGSDFLLHEVHAAIALVPETAYRCRVVAQNPDASEVDGQAGGFTSKKALEIEAVWVSAAGSDHATLDASVNPLGIPATGYFEYIDAAAYERDVAELGPEHGFDHARKAPDLESGEEPVELGAAESPTAARVTVTGLRPATAYRYRFLATDPLIAPKAFTSSIGAFATFATGAGGLADGRAWELVSPNQKNSAQVGVPSGAGGLFLLNEDVPRVEAAAQSSQDPAVTYTSWTSFGEAGGAPGTSQYLSKRTAGGWVTENISPAGRQFQALYPPLRGFSPDLRFAAVVNREPALTADAQPGLENMYLRDNDSGELATLTKEPVDFSPGNEPQTLRRFCTAFGGASADGARAFFAADGAIGAAPHGAGFSLYEWTHDGPLGLVSVLPDGAPAPPAAGTHFGGDTSLAHECFMDQGPLRHAVSEDGSVAFWTFGGTYKESPEPLLARIDGTETVQLDAKVAGEKNGGQGHFWAASADGSKAFFTAPGRLTSKAHAAGQLYMYDTESRTPTDLTPGSVAPEIGGVIGAADDGSAVYFVGKGALTGSQENGVGEKAEEGANNLYSWREGEGLRFIAILSNRDEAAWGVPSGLTARLTPDGEHLAFLSTETEALSGYDNLKFPAGGCRPDPENGILGGDPHCAEAYLYDAESHDLACVSCNPSGSRPAGPTSLPAWTNPLEGPRFLSADGARLFFDSRDGLSAGDENEKQDVYEFERPGTGTCSPDASSFIEAAGGCLSLISSGRSEDDSYFIDASADGRDVFFSTRESLVGWDGNGDFDVYDARQGGGFPEPPPASQPCEGESCKPASPAPPGATSPGTKSFEGPGNPRHATKPSCGKGKRAVKKHAKWRCAEKNSHGKAKKHHKHTQKRSGGGNASAGHNGRAGR